ncbi:hypothetical protein RP20_CCG027776 [Aedes albopictus]|nr:hypothetical protein RP20_CCG027776 [Aedes albopictus]
MKERDDARQRESEEVIPVNNGRGRGTGRVRIEISKLGKRKADDENGPIRSLMIQQEQVKTNKVDAVVVVLVEEDGRR